MLCYQLESQLVGMGVYSASFLGAVARVLGMVTILMSRPDLFPLLASNQLRGGAITVHALYRGVPGPRVRRRATWPQACALSRWYMCTCIARVLASLPVGEWMVE